MENVINKEKDLVIAQLDAQNEEIKREKAAAHLRYMAQELKKALQELKAAKYLIKEYQQDGFARINRLQVAIESYMEGK